MTAFRSFALLALTLVATIASAAESTQPSSAAGNPILATMPPESYLVYVDLPTGCMFVKTPIGWQFKGSLPQDRISSLPAGVYTSLLDPVTVTAGPDSAAAAVLADGGPLHAGR